MSLQPEPIGPVPDETARVAHASFPKGNVYVQMRDLLGPIYDDESFASLFATRGRPAEAPWRLALVTVMQFSEGLSDRQAAEAVRARIDWKYALGLELTDHGFDFSVLSEFRSRLVQGAAEQLLLDQLLGACKERGYLKARGRQRTDSTHVLGLLRVLNRLECVAETLRHALNAVAVVAPEWLHAHVPLEWFERYSRRIEEYRLPRGKEARRTYAETVGADGMRLLSALWTETAPATLCLLPAVETLRRMWISQYVVMEGQIQLRDPKDMPPAAQQLESPYELEARYGEKRGVDWIGYKTHLTETCDDELPHVLTQVETTIATEADMEQLSSIQEGLAHVDLLPAQHLVDGGYVRARDLVRSRAEHQVDVVGPISDAYTWQAKAKQGYDLSAFQIDWEARQVRCPQLRTSTCWSEVAGGRKIHVAFAAKDCTPCPVRPLCTRAKTTPRCLTFRPREEYEALQWARARQATPEFAAVYAQRAGVEGTISQGVRSMGLRKARYRGLARTHMQGIATAAAINVKRLANWFDDVPQSKTRCSPFAALAPVA
ncbi:MAG TPA: IS1182 family transposase [Chloroflexota bacterium]|nr:IS1182 family transposase [Chloroflexota bacterium]